MDVEIDIEPFDIAIGFWQIKEFLKFKETLDEFLK